MTLDTAFLMQHAPQATPMEALPSQDHFSLSRRAQPGPGVPMASITIAHASLLVGTGLSFTLGTLPEFEVRVWRGAAARPQIKRNESAAHIVIGDFESMERLIGDDAFRKLVPDFSRVKFVLVAFTDDAALARKLGPFTIDACLSMDCQPEDLIATVRALCCRLEPARQPLVAPHARAVVRGGLAPGALRRVREHIHSRLADRIQLSELAAIAELSDCHFSRAFKQSMGMPPHQYVMQRRIEVAAMLIEQTDRPLSEIALEVGFSDQSHFTRMFSRLARQTPRDYRHRCR